MIGVGGVVTGNFVGEEEEDQTPEPVGVVKALVGLVIILIGGGLMALLPLLMFHR